MKIAYLSHSHGCKHLLETFRQFVTNLGFEVDTLPGPDDQQHPALQRIQSADCVVILFGPETRPDAAGVLAEAARRVQVEAIQADTLKKPIAMLIHQGTKLEGPLAAYGSAPTFDFWDPSSYLERSPQIVKHLLDLLTGALKRLNTRWPTCEAKSASSGRNCSSLARGWPC